MHFWLQCDFNQNKEVKRLRKGIFRQVLFIWKKQKKLIEVENNLRSEHQDYKWSWRSKIPWFSKDGNLKTKAAAVELQLSRKPVLPVPFSELGLPWCPVNTDTADYQGHAFPQVVKEYYTTRTYRANKTAFHPAQNHRLFISYHLPQPSIWGRN